MEGMDGVVGAPAGVIHRRKRFLCFLNPPTAVLYFAQSSLVSPCLSVGATTSVNAD